MTLDNLESSVRITIPAQAVPGTDSESTVINYRCLGGFLSHLHNVLHK